MKGKKHSNEPQRIFCISRDDEGQYSIDIDRKNVPEREFMTTLVKALDFDALASVAASFEVGILLRNAAKKFGGYDEALDTYVNFLKESEDTLDELMKILRGESEEVSCSDTAKNDSVQELHYPIRPTKMFS